MFERYLTDELERIWKEAVVDESRYCPRIGMERLRKTTKHLRQGSWCFSWEPPEFRSGGSATRTCASRQPCIEIVMSTSGQTRSVLMAVSSCALQRRAIGWLMEEMMNWKDLEGSFRGLSKAKHLIQDIWCLCLDSNPATPENKPTALLLHQLVRSV
jgi:hypothetical protein